MRYTIDQRNRMAREIAASGMVGQWDNTMGCWMIIDPTGLLMYARTMKDVRQIIGGTQ